MAHKTAMRWESIHRRMNAPLLPLWGQGALDRWSDYGRVVVVVVVDVVVVDEVDVVVGKVVVVVVVGDVVEVVVVTTSVVGPIQRSWGPESVPTRAIRVRIECDSVSASSPAVPSGLSLCSP